MSSPGKSSRFELPTQIGLNLKKGSPHPLTFVAGYSNGYLYYSSTTEQLSNKGYRVLGVAVKDLPARGTVGHQDESGMTFAGFLAFQDPP